MKQTLTTDRLTLRPLKITDAAWFSSYAGTPEVARMTGSVTVGMTEMAAEFWIIRKLARQQNRLAYPYVMMHEGNPIGMVDLFKRSEDSAFEIGYSMMPDYWGSGFMYEACEAVIEESKRSLGARRIIAGVFIDNPASLRLLSKLGFTAARSHEEWFSMGRMEKAKGVTLTLEMPDLQPGRKDEGLSLPSPHNHPSAMKRYA